jgi:uroporphyrinogen decarboxylase
MQALDGTNQQVPVWFMRQAGRYLPEYQKIKERHSLDEMFRTPALAAEITCQPVGILGVDAAILFADILTLPAAMGFDITFDNQGPRIKNRIDRPSAIEAIHDFEDLAYVRETIHLINDRLSGQVPLIGFAGSPFTVLTYLIEGGSSAHFQRTFHFMRRHEKSFHAWMSLLTKNTVQYLNIQKRAGIQVFQLFDSWAGILPAADFARCVLPYAKEIFQAVGLPSIYFVRKSNHLLPLMDRSGADFLSVDHTVVLGHHWIVEKTDKGIQGNLFNGHLYADYPTLEKEVQDVLVGGQKHRRYIFNLSNGVFPDVEVDKLKFVVEKVHAFEWNKRNGAG